MPCETALRGIFERLPPTKIPVRHCPPKAVVVGSNPAIKSSFAKRLSEFVFSISEGSFRLVGH